jgi:hypothetical protein
MMADMGAQMIANQASIEANMEAEREEMKAKQAKIEADMKADKEEGKANVKTHMQEIMAEMKADREAHVQEIVVKIDAIADKMEAAVQSIRSERDGKIQRRIVNVMEWQEIPKEGAVVASLESKEPGSKELESEVERRDVPTEEAAVKSSGRTKKRPRGRHIAAGRSRKSKELTQMG